jgi:hypothetical protein
VPVPWAREGSGYTLLMEALVMFLSAEMPVEGMADLLHETDTRLWRVLIYYVQQAQARRDWSGVRRIAVDETSARRGHRYVTNVLDHCECSSLSSADFRIAITLSRPIKVMPMVHHTPTPVLMPKNSRASMCTGSSTASGTIYQEAPQAFAEAVIDVDSY